MQTQRLEPSGGSAAVPAPWWSIGGTLMIGLFVAYLDRSNLSVGLPGVARDLGFDGPQFAKVSSWALTAFLIGYTIANILGGLLTRRRDPKWIMIACVAIWSVATLVVGTTGSIATLLVCRVVLGVTEGIYWPQQSRFAKAWFSPEQRTTANSLIQYYGQFLALGLGFMILTPFYDLLGWRALFHITGLLGLLIIVPLYLWRLPRKDAAPFPEPAVSTGKKERLTLASLGGPAFLLLLFSYLTQGALFWGITLWIPLAVKTLGFTGFEQAFASSIPYLFAVVLAIPLSRLSDRTKRRTLIAGLGLLIPGLLVVTLPFVGGAMAKMILITLSLGFYASAFSPNIWSIVQSTVHPDAVGPAAGIINGIGAGGGGTMAGFVVGMLYQSTGSYIPGFATLGAFVVLGGISLLLFGRVTRQG
ncbi:MFS transporter [Paraburkholderia sp. Ac-20336]|uniref:MFS transporter n=1 Tax=Burkholderiaceae TaxID=119060 RepID=UPI0014213D45|nr:MULTISPECIES: MFS transporter [Burkholderiaceae]MBN3801558.1 MFS transporter [Paraburkholderia sp. Ac-20336]MBN3846603.1 MFS transporter [Paraburkholderia sp. Ac-20342]NIF55688.1 MFS transporter [Burkholderia sp. Ax-1724]NIF78011.1 MFS transporter [Paraburkholderia sp. Cy-641]